MMVDLFGSGLPAALLGLARNSAVDVDLVRRLTGSADEQMLFALCGRVDLTEDIALALARHEQLRVRLAWNFPVAMRIWRHLAADPDPSVRAALAGGRGGTMVDPGHQMGRTPDPPLPDEVGQAMLADTHPRVRLAMAKRDRHTEEVFRLLAADPSPKCRKALATRWKGAPPTVVRDWLTDPEVRPHAMWHHVPPDDIVAFLLADPDPYLRAQVASRGALDPDTAAACARSDDPLIRQAVARNRRVATSTVLALVDDPDPDVRLALASRPDLSEALRERAIRDIDMTWNRTVADWLLPHAAPLEIRLAHVASAVPFVRRTVAHSTDLPDAAAARLFEDPDPTVRVTMAEHHPNTPAHVLVSLSRTSTIVALQLSRHPSFPAAEVNRYALSGDPAVRIVAAVHPRISAEVAADLAQDRAAHIRGAVAYNPAAPAEVIVGLLSDADRYVVLDAAANPALPMAVARDLVRAAQDDGLLPDDV